MFNEKKNNVSVSMKINWELVDKISAIKKRITVSVICGIALIISLLLCKGIYLIIAGIIFCGIFKYIWDMLDYRLHLQNSFDSNLISKVFDYDWYMQSMYDIHNILGSNGFYPEFYGDIAVFRPENKDINIAIYPYELAYKKEATPITDIGYGSILHTSESKMSGNIIINDYSLWASSLKDFKRLKKLISKPGYNVASIYNEFYMRYLNEGDKKNV